jgi:spermidine dehydrogenase
LTLDYWGFGIDVLSAYDAMDSGNPGFSGLALPTEDDEASEPYIYHFPDGNASIARLLVRSLIPAVAAGSTMDDIVLADFDYSKLDQPGQPIRIRLSSIALSVHNSSDNKGPVDIGYVHGETLHRVQAKQCVLACYNMIIPYLMPELPEAQKEALAASVKVPLVYVNVAIRNWQSFAKLGVQQIYSPTAFFSLTKLDYPVALGGYTNPRSPDEPMVLHMVHAAVVPNQGLSMVDQNRMGRQQLLEMTFEDLEKKVTDQLDRMLGAGGFQSSRDIAAITVNRWPHGYARVANSLFDEASDGPPIYEIARARAGQVSIANSDAAWNAFFHEAIDQAWRAVGELKEA